MGLTGPAGGEPVLEVAVQDVSGALAAVRHGARRLELCAGLAATGGLTPGVGLVEATTAAVDVGVHVLVRPRPGGFVYDESEVDVQVREVRAAVAAGAAGVVVGALTGSGTVDVSATARLVDAAEGREVTFHRALDVVEDLDDAMERLVGLGVARVLTSGGAARAGDGLDRLRATVARAAGRLEVMAGGGVRTGDVAALVGTGVDAVHLSASRHVTSAAGPGGGDDAGYTTTDPQVVLAAATELRRAWAAAVRA